MDTVKAKELEHSLAGKEISGFIVEKLINHGKSAAVFKGKDQATGQEVAIKVFDDELIAKYGDESQIARIERELELVGKSHSNMVKILSGGVDKMTNNHFLVMEFLDGPNIKDALQEIPAENVPTLISQLASCCEYLEGLGLAHRDIKPENIVLLDNYKRLVLLDFGVVRPYGKGDVTDEHGIQAFVGTLQYSSPEFLLRTEEDTPDGWRALTFYQIGAVIHDLVMRSAIFAESEQPFARLVNAVQHDTPTISSAAYPSYLVETAKKCLSKRPELRVELLEWKSFHPPSEPSSKLEQTKARVSQRSAAITAEPPTDYDEADQVNSFLEDVISHLKVRIRSIRNANNGAFPPATITRENNIVITRFGRSQRHSLECNLQISIGVEILDAAVGLMRLTVNGSVSPDIFGVSTTWDVLHQGLSSGNDLNSALEHCMYYFMDGAQQLGALDSNEELKFIELAGA